jgi:hypothetical protein
MEGKNRNLTCAEPKTTDIGDKIRSLQKVRRRLRNIVQQCKTKDSMWDCPLLLGMADIDTRQHEQRPG